MHSENGKSKEIAYLSDATKCIHQHFTKTIALKNGQKFAVVLGQQSLTYFELLHYAQQLSLDLIQKYQIQPQQIVCQCVERSIEMVIGMIAIMMCGGIYCPLSPSDPTKRVFSLMEEVHSKIVLVHNQTKSKFISVKINVCAIDIESQQNFEAFSDNDFNILSNISVNSDDLSHVIFTSGSTGIPKAVSR